MKPSPQLQPGPARRRFNRAQAHVRTLLVAGLSVGVGLGLASLWHSRQSSPSPVNPGAETPGPDAPPLSAGTLALLQSLGASVQIRFYAVLDSATAAEDLTHFAGRVGELLATYQRESGGKIIVTRLVSRTDMTAAGAAGLKAFNLDKGDPCYLGLTVAQGERQETISLLLPEWEQALEADISRAISRVLRPPAPTTPVAGATSVDPAILAEVKRQIPNFDSVSLPEGSRILREAALKDLQSALGELQVQIKAAEQLLAQPGANYGPEKQAALQDLQRLQAQQAEKLKELTLRSSAQIEALRQLKESVR